MRASSVRRVAAFRERASRSMTNRSSSVRSRTRSGAGIESSPKLRTPILTQLGGYTTKYTFKKTYSLSSLSDKPSSRSANYTRLCGN